MSVAMLGHLGLKQETAFGVEATPDVWGEIKSEGISMDNNLIIPRYVGGVRGNKRVLAGPITAGGPIVFDLTPEDLMGWVLKGIFGQAPTTTALYAGVYSHVFKPFSGSALPSFTVQVDAEAGAQNWLGTTFSGFGLSIAPNDLLELSLDVIAQTTKEAAVAVPSFTSLDPWSAYNVDVTLNGVSNVDFESLNLAITNELEGVSTLNNERHIGKNVAKQFDCSGDFALEFGDEDLRRRLWGDSAATAPEKCLDPGSLLVEIEKPTCAGEIVTGSGYYYKISFNFHTIYFATAPANLTGADDRIMQLVAFNTKYNVAQAAMLTVTLINSQASYPDP